jgi:Tfp pilus assembly major pilin PilA
MSMMDEGCVAAVPVDTDVNPSTGSFDVLSLRTGKIVEWHPSAVKAKLYNERTGREEEVMVEKLTTGIIENPFYAVMNARNSTMQRLVRKLNLLDVVDDKLGSSKLDLIIQLPYVVKGDLKKKQAEERRQALEKQLEGSKLGIGYIDGTEKVTQLNRPIENNLLKQVEYLTNLLFSQLGITQGILDGSADENTMNNYITRTVEPFAAAIADEMKFKFLTKTARTQGQSIEYFRDPFRLIPVSQMAEIGDKMRRNEIMTSNEIRQKIGMKPNEDPRADELANPNLAKSKEAEAALLGQSGKPQEPPE